MTAPAPLHPSRRISGSRGELLADPASFYARIAHRHGGIARFRIFHRIIHAVADPALIHEILVARRDNWGKQFDVYRNAEQMLGRGLVSLNDGDEWREHRRIIQPALHRSAMAAVVESINRACDEELDRWSDGEFVDFVPRIRTVTLRIISETLLGSSLEAAQRARLSENLMAASRLLTLKNWSPLALPEPWPTPLNRRLRRFRMGMLGFLDAQVERRIGEGVGERGDLLDLLLTAAAGDQGGSLSRADVAGEMLTVFSAGYDTTSSGLAWAVCFLAENPEEQEKLREEVDAVVGDGAVGWDHLAELRAVERAFDEALRIRPPIHTILRINRDEDELGGYRIPARSHTMISIFGAHRAPGSWDEAEVYRPDRFAGEYDSRAFLPFAAGPRRCVGALFAAVEAKILLARIIQRFRFHLQPGVQVRQSNAAALYPRELHVAFQPRIASARETL